MKLRSLFLFVVAAGLAAGCAVDTSDGGEQAGDGDDVTVDEANAAKVSPGTFKLYAQPRAKPNASCDVHTRLTLAAATYSTATIEEALSGFCELYVEPNPRTYRLRLAGTDCGTRIYAGSVTKKGKRYSVKITDNRARLCENVVAAAVIVEETIPGSPAPSTTTKYSYDGAPTDAAGTATLEGTLMSTMGIGGENTGRSIKTSSEMVELILDAGEQNQFVEGKKARAKGVIKLLSGVETRDRKALDVSELLVCPNPGYVNCMPGPNVRLSNLCAADNRSWVTANCPGVSFAF